MERKIKIKKKKELPLNQIICDHNVRAMRKFSDNSIDSILTDPPYGLEFMGKEWDKLVEPTRDSAGGFLRDGKSGSNPYAAVRVRHGSDMFAMQKWHYKWAKECLRIAKPGAFMLVFGGTRTFHRLTCAIEDVGWQIRDCLMWLYGSGFPKSLDISKAIDKAKGKNREIIGKSTNKIHFENLGQVGYKEEFDLTAPASKLAKLWNGYGTALKPAWEPIIVAMKPVDGNFAKNAEKYGVAGLNIDGGKIGTETIQTHGKRDGTGNSLGLSKYKSPENYNGGTHQGRWPANVILDEEAAKILDRQEDASRFFYIAKASRSERNAGLSGMPEKRPDTRSDRDKGIWVEKGTAKQMNFHPTVKPLELMRYLCMLLKMPNKDQIILDPFVGSGTTCIACKELGINYIGIDNNAEYCEITRKRLKAVRANLFENLPKKKKENANR